MGPKPHCCVLIRVAAVRLIETVAAKRTPNEGHRRVDNEGAEQDEPRPKQSGTHSSRLQREAGHHHPEKTATYVTHKDSGWRPVPDQKAECCAGNDQR